MKEFYRGSSVYLELTVRLAVSPFTLSTPSAGCTIDILDENENKVVGGTAMDTSVTGIYYYSWATDDDQAKGVYTARGFAVDGTPATYSVDEIQFRIK